MTTEELLALENEMNNSKGREIQLHGIFLETSFKIAQLNLAEFLAFLEIANNNAKQFQQRGLSVDADIKPKQLLTNYLLTISALIDHERKTVKKINNDRLTRWYKEEISSFFTNNEIHHFYIDLRNYISHFTSLNFTHCFSFDEKSTSFSYGLDRDYLLKWNEWKSLSRKWIEQQPDTISIKDTIVIFNKQITDAFFKLISKTTEIYSNELQYTKELEDKYNKIIQEITYIDPEEFKKHFDNQ